MHNETLPSRKIPLTWFLVADGRTAQIYTYKRVERLIPRGGDSSRQHYDESWEKILVPVTGTKLDASSDENYETGNARLGRVFESQGSTRHMSEPREDIHDEIRHDFVKAITSKLSLAKSKKAFDQLVLVASPKMLGEIKKHLADNVRKSVVAELSKDFTKFNDKTLSQHLQHVQ